jgi:hypothetical protein
MEAACLDKAVSRIGSRWMASFGLDPELYGRRA